MQYNELIDKVAMRLRLNSAAKAERRMIATLSAFKRVYEPRGG